MLIAGSFIVISGGARGSQASAAPGTHRACRGASCVRGDISYRRSRILGHTAFARRVHAAVCGGAQTLGSLSGNLCLRRGAAHFCTDVHAAHPCAGGCAVPFFPFGLRTAAFASADYYPLLPWGAFFRRGCGRGEARRYAAGEEVRKRAARFCVAEPPLAPYLSCTSARAARAGGAFAACGAGGLTPAFFGCIVPT